MLSIVTIVLVGAVLYFARPVVLPLLMASFLAVLIQPLLRWLTRRLPMAVALLITILGLLIVIVGGISLFVSDMVELASKTPQYAERVKGMVDGVIVEANKHGLDVSWEQINPDAAFNWLFEFLTAGLQSLFEVLAQTALVLIMMVFLVLEAPEFRRKIALGLSVKVSQMVLEATDSIIQRIQSYMITKTAISLATGLGTTVVTLALGIDFPILWGIIAFLLNYVPNVGSVIAVAPPVLLALLQFDTLTRPLICLIGLGSTQFSIGNIVEPKVMGRSLNLSTFVVFVSLIFWGWLWGLIGVILAVPLTSAIKIVCEHIERLRPIAIFPRETTDSVPQNVPMISLMSLPSVSAVPSAHAARREALRNAALPGQRLTNVSSTTPTSPEAATDTLEGPNDETLSPLQEDG